MLKKFLTNYFCNNYNLQIYFVASGWAYREIPPIQKKYVYAAEAIGAIMWWWVLWHFWHDFGHIVVSTK